MPHKFVVYILQSERTGRYYIGQTSNLEKRLRRHASGGTRFPRNRGLWQLIHVEVFSSRAEAVRREHQIKNWKSHRYLASLVTAAR